MSEREQARVFSESTITARCIDCSREFVGPLALRFVKAGDVDLVEILVIDTKRSEMHAIARVDYWNVPNVIEKSIHLGHA